MCCLCFGAGIGNYTALHLAGYGGRGEALEASEQEQGLSWKQAVVRLIGGSSILGCLQAELERTSKLTGADLAGENQPQLPAASGA